MVFGRRSRDAQTGALAMPGSLLVSVVRSVPYALRETLRREASSGNARRPNRHYLTTTVLGLAIGFGGATAGSSLVQASERVGVFGFFQQLFAPQIPEHAPQRKARQSGSRYAALPNSRGVTTIRPRNLTPRPPMAIKLDQPSNLSRARRPKLRAEERREARLGAVPAIARSGPLTVCVRTCDGYLFPLGRLASRKDLPVHVSACAAACPSTQTALFVLPSGKSELQDAVSVQGSPYLSAAWANVYRQKHVRNCSCNPPGVAVTPLPLAFDATVRVGDIVTTGDSAQVVTKLASGDVSLADYRGAGGMGRGLRREVEKRVGTMRREAEDAKFRRLLRVAATKSTRVRMAELASARLRFGDTRVNVGGFVPVANGNEGFAPARVVVSSPYGQ